MEKFELGPLQKEWVKTLREHPERQHTGSLGYKDGDIWNLCCLGQLLVLAKGESVLSYLGNVYCNSSSTQLEKYYGDYGLKDEEGRFYDDNGHSISSLIGGTHFFSLADANDGGLTWPEIADFIEANPEKVFTKAV